MQNKRIVNMEEYYSRLKSMPLNVFSRHIKRKTKCRACLQDGDMPMTSVKNLNAMKEALNIFGDVEIEDEDENPTYLCYVCYKFLKSATLFRQVAQRTNETLSQPIVKQSPDHNSEYDDFGSYDDNTLDQSFQPTKSETTKRVKREPVTDGNKVQCPICNKLLGKSYYYNIHLQLHNPNLPDQYMCDICGKSFKLKKVYTGHMARHETRYIFKCDLCPYAGRYKERLSMHMRVHNGELKYLCTQCPARYVTRGRLNDHVRLKHTKPQYKCTHCDKAYHDNLNLQRHIDAAHLGILSHVCHLCGKAFGYRKVLLEHLRTIHKITMRPNARRFIRKAVGNDSKQC